MTFTLCIPNVFKGISFRSSSPSVTNHMRTDAVSKEDTLIDSLEYPVDENTNAVFERDIVVDSLQDTVNENINAVPNANMVFGSLKGSVTENEIKSFIKYIQTLEPVASNVHNEWAQGKSGENLKAMALVYDISPRIEIMNKMVSFCDTLLSIRNDRSAKPRVIWTGRIDPVWLDPTSENPLQTGGEQGDPVGHLAACARQILQTPTIHDKVIPGRDRYGLGKTYLERAKRYLREAEKTVNEHILKSLLMQRSDRQMHFSEQSPYKGNLPVPWNQQMMFNYGFMHLAEAHRLINYKVSPERAKRYDDIIKSNIKWFFEKGVSSGHTGKARLPVYNWGYTMPDTKGEDCNHGSLDVAGLYRLYASGRYGIKSDQFNPIANTVTDVICRGRPRYAGRLDGSSSSSSSSGNSTSTDRLRSGFLFMALFKSKAYEQMMKDAGIKSGGSTNRIDVYSRGLWVKHKRYQQANVPKPRFMDIG